MMHAGKCKSKRMPKAGWLVLDSSDWTVEQTVEAVLRKIGA